MSLRQNWMGRTSFLAICAVVLTALYTSCGSRKFTGTGAGSQSATPERDLAEAQSVPAFSESFEDSIAVNLVAKETIEIPMLKGLASLPSGVVILDSSLPPGATIDPKDMILRWPSDLEDLGAAISGTMTVGSGVAQEKISLNFNVSAPIFSPHACSMLPEPVIGDIKPMLKWHWKGFSSADALLRYATTYSAPVAGDLNADGVVDIVTIASKILPSYSYDNVNGALMVLNGKTGAVVWNALAESNIEVEASTTPALADLDGDGWAEIIAATVIQPIPPEVATSRALVILDIKTKAIRATFQANFICGDNCMPSVADIDGDGKADISAGNAVLNERGALKFYLEDPATTPPAPREVLSRRNTTTLADLDKDSPGLEIISNGAQVYSSLGKLLWSGACRGFTAVADLDKNGIPELVCIGGGQVYSYSSKGVLNWTKPIPQVTDKPGLRGGAPNIGNFNKDAPLEIGTAGGDYYVVYDYKGNELWKVLTVDRSSHSTGSTVFDFNGDGAVEVVYNDEQKLRIYNGETGAVLWETENPSGTLWEYPLIVNVDDDPSVEIVVSAPGGVTNYLEQGGIRVYDDPSNKWVSSRKVWNQYNYYPEIVQDNLQVTKNPGPPASGFRVNSQGAIKRGDRILLPDAELIAANFSSAKPDGSYHVYSLLQNRGEGPIPAGTTIRLNGKNADGSIGELLGEAVTANTVEPSKDLLIPISISSPLDPDRDYVLRVNLDEAGKAVARECDDVVNNTLSFKIIRGKR